MARILASNPGLLLIGNSVNPTADCTPFIICARSCPINS